MGRAHEKVAFGQRPEGEEEGSYARIWGELSRQGTTDVRMLSWMYAWLVTGFAGRQFD